jgi:anaerobic magnesium-protoporphyrin IX monomethyl ester cyclase
VSGRSGDFREDWRLMNCLNFVFRPEAFTSREEMDALYNWHVRRYYDSKGFRRRFGRRLWQHRRSLWHLAKNTPRLVQAARYFSANRAQLEAARRDFPLHPSQPQRLPPMLGPELRADAAEAMRPGPVAHSAGGTSVVGC